ncbi:helix-turn-helix domain-containing protein [Dactylosporangium darangshiense]|uniref:XRE family transcriptional regulator n=1 Tax=Dactylosporangium darangshiense TaxID=579108 RepID=A0ABP8DSK9_9ACTN
MTTTFALMLRTARHECGLTLEELSEASGVSVRALSDMERGRALGPQRRTVELIADALKLDGARRDEFVALAKAGRTRSGYLTAAPGLCELPGSIGDFTGRTAELAWISGVLDALDEPEDRLGAAVISGGAGVGKTTLVVRAAHRLRDRFPDGMYFVDALGMSQRPVASAEILGQVLRAMGVRDQQMPQAPAERAGHYRQLLRQRRVLVIVDDAAAESQVRPLLPGGGPSQLIVTSRRLLAGLEGVQRLHLDPMPAADAKDLLGRILAERFDAPRADDLQELVDMLGGLPLAVRIVGNRLISRPGWSTADLVARLSVAERRLDQLSAGDLKMAAAFEMSYEQLPDPVRPLFRRASLVPGADFSAVLLSVIGEVAVSVAEDQLDDLVDLGLLEAAEGGRYRFHDLVRLYASQRLEAEDPVDVVADAKRRMVAWLLDTLTTAGRWFQPGGADTAVFGSAEDAEAWIRAEAEHWFQALGAAAVAGDHRAVVRAVNAAYAFHERWVHWPRWSDVFTLALDSAVQLGDAALQAEFLNYLAYTHTLPWRANGPAALDRAQRARTLARQAGDLRQEAFALLYTAAARRGRPLRDLEAALSAIRQAADLFERAGDVGARVETLLGAGVIAFDLGDAAAALAAYRQALAVAEDPDSGLTTFAVEAILPHILGHTAQALGRLGRRDEAIPMMLRAVDLFGGLQVVMGQAAWLRILGEELYGDDHAAEARASLSRAGDLYETVGQHDRAAYCRGAADAICEGGRN